MGGGPPEPLPPGPPSMKPSPVLTASLPVPVPDALPPAPPLPAPVPKTWPLGPTALQAPATAEAARIERQGTRARRGSIEDLLDRSDPAYREGPSRGAPRGVLLRSAAGAGDQEAAVHAGGAHRAADDAREA